MNTQQKQEKTAQQIQPQKTLQSEQQLKENQIRVQKDGHGQNIINQEEIPDHFYDSDLASINEKDFLSDNQPPKDLIQERKLLYKQKKLHVLKTIVRLGSHIDKPARYDKIKLKVKQVPANEVIPYPLKKQEVEFKFPQYFSSYYLMDVEEIEYNLGKDHQDIERLVTSMKRGETAIFQLEHLQTSKKSGIKLRQKVEVFVIGVIDWLTVIDMDCDGKYMKEILRKGQGHSRINKYDEVSYQYIIQRGNQVQLRERYDTHVKLQDEYIEKLPRIVWKLLNNVKSQEMLRIQLSDELLRQCEGQNYTNITKQVDNSASLWTVTVEVFYFHSIDDIFMDGRLLKKMLARGVSTAKPESSSYIYYAMKYLNQNRQVIYQDQCFDSDWWEDYQKLEELNCRKNYLDDYSVSEMLKQAIKRMKPAEIAEIECRDKELFQNGHDFEDYKKHNQIADLPEVIHVVVRVYNFTDGKNCFNMEIDEKVNEAWRKKAIAIKLLKSGNIPKALKTFENIVSYFGSGNINQQSYDEKISALMNSILCHMKNQNYIQIIKLSDQILEKPKHGYDINKMKIKGPMAVKVQGKIQDHGSDQRQDAGLMQNEAILDKCLYRKALALTKMGEGEKALACISTIKVRTEEVECLKVEAQKLKQKYEKKSVKMFKNMFG